MSMLLTSVNDIDSRLEGIKNTGKKIDLEDYAGQMGTGLIDAYKLLMQVEGTPCVTVTAGKEVRIILTSIFGGSAKNLTYTKVSMSAEGTDLHLLYILFRDDLGPFQMAS